MKRRRLGKKKTDTNFVITYEEDDPKNPTKPEERQEISARDVLKKKPKVI